MQLKHIFPAWLTIIYGTACGFLIPWTIFLGFALPPHYVSHHWDIAWTGFDIFETLLFAVTAFLAIKRSSWTAISASMLGTVILFDTWFDILTASPGRDQHTAVVEALFIELPLAVLSFVLAYRIFSFIRHASAQQ